MRYPELPDLMMRNGRNAMRADEAFRRRAAGGMAGLRGKIGRHRITLAPDRPLPLGSF
jgi:hypothetical protein